MLQALVWDVDGTLAETEHDGHRVAFNQAFAEEGLAWHWTEALYRDLLATTGGKERMRGWWQGIDPAAAAAPEAAARIARLHARKTAIYVDLVARGAVQLRPGVARLLHAARSDGLVLAIATTTSPENVQALLQATLGADSPAWFACIGAGDVVPQKKPAPDIYHWVLQHLGLPAQCCLALEDSAPGCAAALAAGLPTVVTRSRYTTQDPLPAHPLLRADLPDLAEVDLAQLRAWHAA
jgi:beta-phosphoglucomutase-like phosphatase (HAD superfamily)